MCYRKKKKKQERDGCGVGPGLQFETVWPGKTTPRR